MQAVCVADKCPVKIKEMRGDKGPGKEKQGTPGGTEYGLNDLGTAGRLASLHGENIRYCDLVHKWFVWDSKRWETDATKQVWRCAVDTVRSIYAEASKIEDQKKRTDLINYARSCETDHKIKAIVSAGTYAVEDICLRPEVLDTDKMLLNVLNGTIDLRTGELREHRREDYITKLAPVNYNPKALCPKWLEFLHLIMCGNMGLIDYLRVLSGYCLTGDVGRRKIDIFFGGGHNGKSTFLQVIKTILGDYAMQADPELLLVKPKGTHPTYLADLKGKRFAITIETEEEKQMAAARVKWLTGGADTIRARKLYEDAKEFEPTHKIILATNYKPVIKDTTSGLWGRIALIPFNHIFAEKDQIKNYHEILLEEREGILRWALSGCETWQAEGGIKLPPEVTEATRAYKTEEDIMECFLGDCCMTGQGFKVTNKALRAAYEKWCGENGEQAISPKALALRLKLKHYTQDRDREGRFWHGIGLRGEAFTGRKL
jgi:putative DNA primase/helicase